MTEQEEQEVAENVIEQMTPKEEADDARVQVDPEIMAACDNVFAIMAPLLKQLYEMGSSVLLFVEMPTSGPDNYICSTGLAIKDDASDRAKCVSDMCSDTDYASFVLQLVKSYNEAVEHAQTITQGQLADIIRTSGIAISNDSGVFEDSVSKEGPIFSRLIRAPNRGNVA